MAEDSVPQIKTKVNPRQEKKRIGRAMNTRSFPAQKELFNSECCGDSKLILKGLDYKDFIVLPFVNENSGIRRLGLVLDSGKVTSVAPKETGLKSAPRGRLSCVMQCRENKSR